MENHTSDYFFALMKLFDIVYDEVLTYFIHTSPKILVTTSRQIDHDGIKERCIHQTNKHFIISPFTHSISELVTIVYNTFFGENGKLLDDYVYQTKGQGWCKRVFPPTDNEMQSYIVQCVTEETQKQYKKMLIL
jgi:hypothetical protein